MNILLQQYRFTPRESMTFDGSSPVLTRFEYSACLSAISPPQVKHLTGMSISRTFVSAFKHYKNHYRLHKC